MGTRAWMLRTFVGCCAWILHGLNAAVAVPVPTEGPFGTGTAFPSAAESQAPRALVPGTTETSTAAPLPPATTVEVPALLMDDLLGGGPTSPAFPTGAELSDVATAAREYGPHAATTESEYSPRSPAGSDAEAGPLPPEPEETQVPAGDPQALTNATRSVNDAPAADAALFSTHEPLFSPSADPSIMGAAPNTPLGTTLASPQFMDVSNNVSVSVTREGAEGLEPVADTTSVPNFPSASAPGTQPTPRATGYPTTNNPLGLGITALPSRGLDTATTGVSKEAVTLAVGFQSGASAPSLSPNPGELLATQQHEQASEATQVTQEPAGETGSTAEEHPAPLEAGNAGDTPGDAFGAPDLSHPSLGSETVSGTVGNPEKTSRLAGKTEPSLETSLGPDRVEEGSPGVDLDSPYSAPSPAASEVLAAPAEPDVKSVSSSSATTVLPARMALLPAGTAATDEPSLLPVPWDAAAGGLPSPVDIPNGSSSSPASSSTADSPQPAPDAVASTLPGADDGAEVLASPNLNTPVSPSLGEPELRGTAAGTSEGAGLPSEDGPGISLNPALDDPSLASRVPGGWLGTGPEQAAAEGSEAGAAEQALGGGGSTAGDEPSLSSASVSKTAAGIDQDTSSPSALASSGDVTAASSASETDAATSSNPALDASSSVSLAPEGPGLPGASLGLPAEEGSEAVAAEQVLGGGGSAAGAASSSNFIPGSGTALGTDQLPDTGSPAGPSSPIDVAAASAGSETDATGPIAEAAPGPGGLSQVSLAGEGHSDLAAAPGDSPQLAPGASTLPGADDGAETPETAASPNFGAESLSLGGLEPQETVSGSAVAAGLPLADGQGTSSNPALDASSSGSSGPEGPELPGASLGLPAEDGSEAVAAEQKLGGGGSAAGVASSSSFIPGSGTALGTDQLPDTGSPAGPSPIDVAAASAVSETDAIGPIPEAAPGPDGLSQVSLASEGDPDLAAALGAETAGTVAGAGTGNLVSTSPDTDKSPPAFRPQQDTATLGEPSAGEDGALTDSELSPPSLLRSRAGEAIVLGEQSLPGPAAPGSSGLVSDLGTDAGRGDLASHPPSAPDSSQLAPGGATSPLPGPDHRAETAASSSLGAKPLSLGESEPQGTVSGSAVAAGLPSANGLGTNSNPALDSSSSVSLAPEGPGLPGASLGLPAEDRSEATAAEQVLGGGGSAVGAASSSNFIPGSGTALGTDQLLDTESPAGPSSPIDVAAASAGSETDAIGPIAEAAPGPGGLSQASLAGEGDSGVAAAPGDSPQLAPGASTLPGADDGAETPETAASPNFGAESLSLGGLEPQETVSGSVVAAGLPLANGQGTSSNPALDASSSGSSGPEGLELPGANLGLPAEEGSEAVAAEQVLGGGGSAAGAASSSNFIPGSGTALGTDQLPDTGSPAGPSSPIDVAAASAGSETDAIGPIAEAAPGPGGLSQASLAGEGHSDLAAAPGDSPQLAPGASTLPGADDGAETPETAASPNFGAGSLSLEGLEPQETVSGSAVAAGVPLADGQGTSSNPALDASSSGSSGPKGPELPGANLGLPAEEGSEATAAERVLGGGGSAAGAASSSNVIPGNGTALGTDQLPDTGSPAGPSSPIDVAAASAGSETDAIGPIAEAAPGPGGLSQVSLAGEGDSGVAAAPGDSPQLAPGASTLPGADDRAETPETAASPNFGAGSLSLGGLEPQETVSGSAVAAGLPLADGQGTSSNPALDASSSGSSGPEGLELPGANLGLPAEDRSEAVAAEQVLGGGGSAAGAASSSNFIPGSGTALGTDQLPDTGSSAGPSPIDVAAASAVSETDAAGPITEGAPGPGGPSQASLAGEVGPDVAAAPGDSPQLAPRASTLPGADNTAETPASPNLNSPMVPSLGGLEPQRTVGSTSNGAGLPGSSGPGLNPALEAQSPASFSLGGPMLPVPQGSPGAGPGLPAAEGSEAGTVEQIPGEGGSTAGAEQSLGSALGTSKVTVTDQLPDAGSPPGPASAGDVAVASPVWDTDNVNNLGGVPGAPGISQPALGAAPASGGAQPELPPATAEADKLAKAVSGEGASPGESQGSVAEGTSVLEAFDGAGTAVEHSAPSSLSVGGSSSLGTASVATEGAGLPDASGGASDSNTAASGPGSSGAEGAPVSAPSIQSGSDLGDSEAKPSQADVVELPGGERGVPADNEASLGAILGAGAGGIVQAAPGVLAPLALASPQRVQTLLPPALDTGVATAGIASLLGSSLLLPAHGPGALPASLEGTGGSSGLVPKEKLLSPSSIHSGSSLGAAGAALPAANVPHGPLAGAETTLPWSPDSELASGMPAPLGEEPPAALASPNVGPAVRPAAGSLSPGSRFSSPGSTSDLTAGPSPLENGALGAASAGPFGSALLLPPTHPKSPGVPSAPAAAEGRGDADSPGQLSPGLPGAAAGPGAAAQLPPRTAAGPPAQSSIAQGSTGGSSGLAPIGVAAGTSLTKFPGAGSAGGSSPAVLQPSSSSKAAAGLSHAAAAGPAAARPVLPGAVPGQGAAQGGPPATARPPVSCSPTATAPASQASLRKVIPERGANGAAALLPQASSNAFPAPLGGPMAPAAPLPMAAAVPLYAYGTRENDHEYVERRVDFNSPLFKPETGFPFGKALRDSLYFTDNGQIIFPASDKNLFPFPNPPPGGFTGREKVPMIAVFWDDADFSRGVGTTFYQEFFTLNSAKPPFVHDVEAKIRRYMKTSYSAVWTLKITWEKAPAHTARMDTRRTSTYQAVLTTDGFRSYLLILYQDGGMRWDYSHLAATNVLIGYSSGDGSYHNDDLTRRPAAAKYRPDQFRGSNTDLRGLWIYKLESRVGANYRLKCLAWTGRQQEPRVWSQDLPSCPCSLQRGQRDPRFRSARGGRLDGSRLTMLHSASPNQHGAGIRCLYDSQGRFAEGRQERYWRSSRQASSYRDQELKLHDWCCNQAGSAQLCARYSEKRPKIGCDGYQAPGTGRSSEEANSHSEEQEDGDAE